MGVVTLHIEGMSCGHCLKAVNAALDRVAGSGLESVQMGRAVVNLTGDGPTTDDLVTAVEEAGYKVALVDGVA
jgi:copper chaperone CopZ